MVFQKALDIGFNQYRASEMPWLPIATKGKRSARRKAEDSQTNGLDMLVAAATGEFLLPSKKGDLKPSDFNNLLKPALGSKIKKEIFEEVKVFKEEAFDQGSCNESTLDFKVSSQRQIMSPLKENTQAPTLSPTFVKADASVKDMKSGFFQNNGACKKDGMHLEEMLETCGGGSNSPNSVESCQGTVEDGILKSNNVHQHVIGGLNIVDTHELCSEDPTQLDAKPAALLSSDSSAKVPLPGSPNHCYSSFPNCNSEYVYEDRDDDENSSGCTHPCTITSRPVEVDRVVDRRIRKVLPSKHRRTAPALSKNGNISNNDLEMKPLLSKRKLCCTRQRTVREPFKIKKVVDHCLMKPFEKSNSLKHADNLPEMGFIQIGNSCGAHHVANGATSSTTGQGSPHESEDFHVKLKIESLMLPEFFIPISDTSTVGSLKRRVMDAVNTILKGGLRVGVVLQGKKVRDDNKTLYQAGISRANKLDSLEFMLEPSTTPSPLEKSEEHYIFPCDITEPLARLPTATPSLNPNPSVPCTVVETPIAPIVSVPESDHDSVQSPVEASSRALVPVPHVSVEAFSLVPIRKSKRSELVQRRIRRPFSVAEVEALVFAVEKLGTGRWRDVKLRAFENAKHRTYVDLKDKWKTLVHTARISPQQRRGEPVPQELLDRVLSAHAYWSEQQAKLQAKLPATETYVLHKFEPPTPVDMEGV